MSKLFIADLQGKEEIESIFSVKIFNTMEGKDGRKYFNIILSDATGDLEARLWQYSEEVEKNMCELIEWRFFHSTVFRRHENKGGVDHR